MISESETKQAEDAATTKQQADIAESMGALPLDGHKAARSHEKKVQEETQNLALALHLILQQRKTVTWNSIRQHLSGSYITVRDYLNKHTQIKMKRYNNKNYYTRIPEVNDGGES